MATAPLPSKKMRGRHTAPVEVPEVMVFEPTWEEFQDFEGYMQYMEHMGAHHAGIAKIIPPKEWVPRKKGYDVEDLDLIIEGPLKQQFTSFGRGSYQTKSFKKQPQTVKEYHEMATSNAYKPPAHENHDDLERKYWKGLTFVPPIYGADVSDSITDDDVDTWNIGRLPSILKYVNEDLNQRIHGVNTPYLYFGMWKATFSWHVEDMDLYGINFLHHGLPKTWYCVPPKYGYLLEQCARTLFPNIASWCSNFMRHKTCLISPTLLDEFGVPYTKVVQEERHIIIVYPYAYHAGFNHGFNIAESTNFALERWIEYGKRHRPCDCTSGRVKFSMDNFVKRFQPDRYEAWLAGKDIAPHPEDPPDLAEEIRLRATDFEAYKKLVRARNSIGMSATNTAAFRASSGRKFTVNLETMKFYKKTTPMTPEEKAEFEVWKKNFKVKILDIYQHIEMPQVKIHVDPSNMTSKQIRMLKNMMDTDEIDLEDLIRRGVLIKIGELVMEDKYGRSIEALDNEWVKTKDIVIERKTLHLYQHIEQSSLKVFICPETTKLYGKYSKEVKDFFADKDIELLIQNGIMQKIDEKDYTLPEWKRFPIEKYRHEEKGFEISVNPKTMQLSKNAKVPSEFNDVLGDKTLKELIDQKVLKKVRNAFRKIRPFEQIPFEHEKEYDPTIYKISHKYKHRDHADLVIMVDPKNNSVRRKTEQINEILADRSLSELIDEGIFFKIGEHIVKPGQRMKTEEENLDPKLRYEWYKHVQSQMMFRVNPVDLKPTKESQQLKDILQSREISDLIKKGEVIKMNKFRTFSYAVMNEGLEEVVVSVFRNKTLYKYKMGNYAIKDVFIYNTLDELEETKKLVYNYEKVVKDGIDKMKALLQVTFERHVCSKYKVRASQGMYVYFNPETKDYTKFSKWLPKSLRKKNLDELIADEDLIDGKEIVRINGAAKTWTILGNDEDGNPVSDDLENMIQVRIDEQGIVVIEDKINQNVYIIKTELPNKSDLSPPEVKKENGSKMAPKDDDVSDDEEKATILSEGDSSDDGMFFDVNDLAAIASKELLEEMNDDKKDFAEKNDVKDILIEYDDEEEEVFSEDEDEDSDDDDDPYGLNSKYHSKKRRRGGYDSDPDFGNEGGFKKKRMGPRSGVRPHWLYKKAVGEPKTDREFKWFESDYELKKVRVPIPKVIVEIKKGETGTAISDGSLGQWKFGVGRIGKVRNEKGEVEIFDIREERSSADIKEVWQNKALICKCGERGGEHGRIIGKKRRVRCQKCTACITPKCGNCNFCRHPAMKQTCIFKKCLNPVLPKCPCIKVQEEELKKKEKEGKSKKFELKEKWEVEEKSKKPELKERWEVEEKSPKRPEVEEKSAKGPEVEEKSTPMEQDSDQDVVTLD